MGKKAKVRYYLSKEALHYSNNTVTISEAEVLTGMSRFALLNALQKGQIIGRGSFTGGTWLIDYKSLQKRYPFDERKAWENVLSLCQLRSPETMDG